jgi:hypothetical protein
MSGIPPVLKAITGVAQARLSITVLGKLSSKEGVINASAAA